MNSDIRLSVDFETNPKIMKLKRRAGDAGVLSILRLWCYTAKHRPQGVLTDMDAEDIAIAAGWKESEQDFINLLLHLRLLDTHPSGFYAVHDWEKHNAWAAHAEDRSNMARKAVNARWNKRNNTENTDSDTQRIRSVYGTYSGGNTPLPAPIPTPTPTPTPTPSPSPSPSPPPIGERLPKPEETVDITETLSRSLREPDRDARKTQVAEVFQHWKIVMGHTKAHMDEKRSKIITHWLDTGYSLEDLKLAIDGCSRTPHNMGHNDRDERYDSLELILRDGAHIDRFIENATRPPIEKQVTTNLSPTGVKNSRSLEQWLNRNRTVEAYQQ